VQVGFVGDLTGPAAAGQGIPQLQGAQQAIAYLESSGQIAKGVTYKLVTRDSHSDANVAAASARELTSGGKSVAIIAGGSTEEEQAMQTTIARAKVLNFTAVQGAPFIDQLGTGQKYPWVYQTSENGTQAVDPFVKYLAPTGKETIGELYPDYAYGQTQHAQMQKAATAAGVKLISQSAPATATSFTAQLRKLKAAGADGLVIWLFGGAASAVMTELQQLNWTPSVAGPLGIDNASVTQAMGSGVAAKAVAGPFPTTFLSATGKDPLAEPALSMYQGYAKVSKEPQLNGGTVVASYGFDAMMLLNGAIKATNSTDPTKLRTYLDSGASIKGSRGNYVFGPQKRAAVLGDQLGLVGVATPCSGGVTCKQLGAAGGQ
jgi:branched-chain amino acid transport system substrate-binding protein